MRVVGQVGTWSCKLCLLGGVWQSDKLTKKRSTNFNIAVDFVSVNCIDRHVEKNPDKVALIWEKDEPGQQEYVTYK